MLQKEYKEYDFIIPLGLNCEISHQLRINHGFVESHLFTWAAAPAARYCNALSDPNIIFSGVIKHNTKNNMFNCQRSGIAFHGKRSAKELLDAKGVPIHAICQAEQTDCIARVRHLAVKDDTLFHNAGKKLFIIGLHPYFLDSLSSANFIESIYAILKKRATNFDFLVITDNNSLEQIKNTDNVFIRHISHFAPINKATQGNFADCSAYKKIFQEFRPKYAKKDKQYKYDKITTEGIPPSSLHARQQNLTSLLRLNEKKELLRDLASAYGRIIFIGAKDELHSHRFLFKQYVKFLSKLHIDTSWLENIPESNKYIPPYSLVLIADCLHWNYRLRINLSEQNSYIFWTGSKIPEEIKMSVRHINLIEHRNYEVNILSEGELRLNPAPFIYMFPKAKSLVQPWGTPLMENEFFPPTACRNTNKIFFVGTVWGDPESKVRGNQKIIKDLSTSLHKLNMELVLKSGVNDLTETICIRRSFASLAPSSRNHAAHQYLQCRVFKNISYGRMTFSDVEAFKDILGETYIPVKYWHDAIHLLNCLPENIEMEIAKYQQEKIRNYTYLDMWINMLSCLKNFNT